MWRIDGCTARWKSARVSAQLDFSRPGQGLTRLRVGESLFEGLHPLQVHLSPANSGAELAVDDGYVRGNDLIVTYAETAQRPTRPEIYWRIDDDPGAETITLDAILSNQTATLDADPRLRLGCEVPGNAWLRLHESSPQREEVCVPMDRIDLGEVHSTAHIPVNGPGCALIARLSNGPWSFAQVLIPVDVVHAELAFCAQTQSTRLTVDLFAEHVEKGVIRRAWARCLLVPRESDTQWVDQCWRAARRAEPPLTT